MLVMRLKHELRQLCTARDVAVRRLEVSLMLIDPVSFSMSVYGALAAVSICSLFLGTWWLYGRRAYPMAYSRSPLRVTASARGPVRRRRRSN